MHDYYHVDLTSKNLDTTCLLFYVVASIILRVYSSVLASCRAELRRADGGRVVTLAMVAFCCDESHFYGHCCGLKFENAV